MKVYLTNVKRLQKILLDLAKSNVPHETGTQKACGEKMLLAENIEEVETIFSEEEEVLDLKETFVR